MIDPVTIIHWQRLDERVTTSGQPTEDDLAALARLGVLHVINLALHTHERALKDEAGAVRHLGMNYIHLPVIFTDPTEADFAAFVSAFEATHPEAVHVHCIMNYRVSAFFYRYRRDVLGWEEAKAREAMDRIWRPEGVWDAFIRRKT